ncbi:MAG: hypothetical protein H6552_00420 [Chitinophagales bacterium]|nr:hypothetical protein [Chitinophagales bacterium]
MKYTMKGIVDKSFETKMDLTRHIKKNIEGIYAIKKSIYKKGATVDLGNDYFNFLYEPKINAKSSLIRIKTIINSTNVIDSHVDLHDFGTWNKTVKDNPFSAHLKTHKSEFESLISNKAKSYNEVMNFKDLGLNIDRDFTANINDLILDEKRQPFMFGKYMNGEVTQHSVGMLYVGLELAYYDEESEKNMDFFEKVKSKSINPEIADEYGYVWLVSEAKKREGSAVVFGSNGITPTLLIEDYEPSKDTQSKGSRQIDTSNKAHSERELINFYKTILN